MRKILFFSILTLLFSHSHACIQYYVTDSSGERRFYVQDGDVESPLNIYKLTKSGIDELKAYESQVSNATAAAKYKHISNYCAALIKVGRHKEAVPILKNLLKNYPNEYEINANLAVALELDGQLDEALSFLKKSMSINSSSHKHSEWFHERILESAIALRDKKFDLKGTDVLKIQNNNQEATKFQISYQLKERVPLTKSPNNFLSKVIEECADYYYSHYSIEWAIELYSMAIGYASDNSAEIRLRQKVNSSRQKLLSFKQKLEHRFNYLTKKDWKQEIEKKIKDWRGYSPYYYEGNLKTI